MDHRIYLVINNHPEQGLLGVHADGSSETASEFAWALMQDEAMLAREVVDNGIADEPEHGLRQICLVLEINGEHRQLVEADASNCPHPTWEPIDPTVGFEYLSHSVTPPYIKRWLAFEAWAE